MYLIAGLGNPGPEYENTRHNLGFHAIKALCEMVEVELTHKKLYRAYFAKKKLFGSEVFFLMPLTFMNNSGEAISKVCHDHKIAPDKVIIIHDEMDLDPGVIKIKRGGGAAGHNGLSSILAHLKSAEFQRVRIGIGRPKKQENRADVYADYVLSDIPKAEIKLMEQAIVQAAVAALMITELGVDKAMNTVNKAMTNEPL